MPGAFDQQVAQALAALPERVNADEHLRHIGRYCNLRFMIEVGDTPYHLSIVDGTLNPVRQGPFNMMSWVFAIRGPEASWQRFWSAVPEPGYNDIFAMTAYRVARIEGDVAPLFADLRFIKEILALPRKDLG